MIFRFFRRRRRPHWQTARHRDRFVSQLRQELMKQRDAGWVSEDEFDKTFTALADPIVAQRAISQVDQDLHGVDWSSIIDWVSQNWSKILQVVLAVALLFLGDTPRRDEQLWPEE